MNDWSIASERAEPEINSRSRGVFGDGEVSHSIGKTAQDQPKKHYKDHRVWSIILVGIGGSKNIRVHIGAYGFT